MKNPLKTKIIKGGGTSAPVNRPPPVDGMVGDDNPLDLFVFTTNVFTSYFYLTFYISLSHTGTPLHFRYFLLRSGIAANVLVVY